MGKITALCIIMWIIIDRIKRIWSETKYGSMITSAVALVFGLLISFVYNLDMLYELQIIEYISIGGKIMTAFILMGGSACIHEVLEKISGSPLSLVVTGIMEDEGEKDNGES